jgi:hypothetical protein
MDRSSLRAERRRGERIAGGLLSSGGAGAENSKARRPYLRSQAVPRPEGP